MVESETEVERETVSPRVRRRTLARPGNSRAPAPYPMAEREMEGNGSKRTPRALRSAAPVGVSSSF